MADSSLSPSSGGSQGPTLGSSGLRHRSQQQLSCTLCRQRKIKCDKIHPCSPCQKSNLRCAFPERLRHPKKRRVETKATNEELLRRLGRMEELIEKMKEEGKDRNGLEIEGQSSASPDTMQTMLEPSGPVQAPDINGTDVNRFIGSAYWRRLANEVDGLRQTMDDVSDGGDVSPTSTPSTGYTSHTSILFGASPLPSRELRLLHPSSDHMFLLCDIYARQFEPMFKLMHVPTLRKLVTNAAANIHDIPSGNYVEPVLFAMYYAAITALTPEECLQYFQDGRELLLARYRMGAETALVNADLLNTTELGTVQALVIFIVVVRANDDSQFSWTLVSVAVRLGHAIGLHRENSKSGLSPFTTELRRRLWWQLIALDLRACEERGSDPVILPGSFNTKKCLNINDDDIGPENTVLPVARLGFTEMTKSRVSHIVWADALRIAYEKPAQEGEETLAPKLSFLDREATIDHLEKELESQVLIRCDTSDPLAWTTLVISRLIMARVRLALYHPPLHDHRSASHNHVPGDTVLKVAIENIECSHLLDTAPAAAPWRWFFKTHVQWHCLAATLAELCVQTKGPLVERAWKIVDIVFDDWAARIADSKHGMLWRPIKKLMNKAQAKRNETLSMKLSAVPQQQQPLPQFRLSPLNHSDMIDPMQTWTATFPSPETNQAFELNQSVGFDQGPPLDDLASLNVDETMDTINWAEWDEFMQDFEMQDQSGSMNTNGLPPDDGMLGSWW